MDWKKWIGKIVFIKLRNGTIFSYTKVDNYDGRFLMITDKFDREHSVETDEIVRIGEEKNGKSNGT